jgi:two-component system, cell cycle response regulator
MSEPERQFRRRNDADAETPGPRILAVDDDQGYLAWLQTVLCRAGFDVIVAHDGPTAIDQIRSDPDIGLLLVDLSMPRMDGIETVQQVQAENGESLPALYTILLTSHDGTETKLRALEGGLDDFIPKGAPASEIVAKLRSAARRLEMERRLHTVNEELQALALTDELTGIANRRALFRAADDILAGGRQLSVVLFDLDHFKEMNDTFGHLAGDRVLADVAATLKESTRVGDIIGRYGGDEFVLLLPDTDESEARAIADRLRQLVRTSVIAGGAIPVQMSFGTATSRGEGETVLELLNACDQRLYRRKSGRRTVEQALARAATTP